MGTEFGSRAVGPPARPGAAEGHAKVRDSAASTTLGISVRAWLPTSSARVSPKRSTVNDRRLRRVLTDEDLAMNDDEDIGGGRQPKGRITAFLVLMIAAIVVYAIVLLRLD